MPKFKIISQNKTGRPHPTQQVAFAPLVSAALRSFKWFRWMGCHLWAPDGKARLSSCGQQGFPNSFSKCRWDLTYQFAFPVSDCQLRNPSSGSFLALLELCRTQIHPDPVPYNESYRRSRLSLKFDDLTLPLHLGCTWLRMSSCRPHRSAPIYKVPQKGRS